MKPQAAYNNNISDFTFLLYRFRDVTRSVATVSVGTDERKILFFIGMQTLISLERDCLSRSTYYTY